MSKPKPLSLTHWQYRNYLEAHCYGQANAQTAQRITQETGINSRKQQELKSDWLERGVMICTSCSEQPMGTYIPANDAEKLIFIRTTQARYDALGSVLSVFYRNCPALRPTRLRTPPLAIRPSGEAVTAQMKMEELSA